MIKAVRVSDDIIYLLAAASRAGASGRDSAKKTTINSFIALWGTGPRATIDL